MIRDYFVFYRSFYEGLKSLNDSDRLACYDAITRYGLDGVFEAEGVAAAVLSLIKPIFDANNRKVEAGRKGGEARSKQTQAEGKQNEANPKQSEAEDKLNIKYKRINNKYKNNKDISRAKWQPQNQRNYDYESLERDLLAAGGEP